MKKYILFIILLLSVLNLKAITVSSVPNPQILGQNVRFNISANFGYRDFICPIQINFGDSSNWYDVGVCTVSPCNLSIDYVYNTPGYYTATVQSNCPDTPPDPPDPAYASVSINCLPLSITSSSVLPEGYLNQSYSYQLLYSGGWGTYSFSIISGSLPPGLNLSSSGLIYGIPTEVGDYNFTINLTDTCLTGAQSISKSFSLKITAQCNPLSITSSSSLPEGFLNQSYNYQIQTSGGYAPLIFSLSNGSLPSGLNLISQGIISGVPTMPGIFNFSIMVKDSCPIDQQSATKDFSIKINCNELFIDSPSNLPQGKIGEFYSYQLQTTGGWAPVSFEIINGALPAGLTLTQQGLISGIPNSAGIFNFEVKARDSCPIYTKSISKNFMLEVIGYELNLNVIPSSFYIPKGEESIISLSYQFTASQNLNTTLTSQKGYFYANGDLIYENESPLNIKVQNGSGLASERLPIPFKVVERIINKNLNYFIYKRTFSRNGFEIEGTLNLFITTEGSSNFMIKRVEIFFENWRAEATVKRNYKNLKAYALVSFVGSGILEGYWDVDGIVLGRVYEVLNYGDNIKIRTPEAFSLPTFEPGIHNLKFVIISPKIEIEIPSIFYFVDSLEEEFISQIKILKPEIAELNYMKTFFEWEKLKDANYYVLEFYEDRNEKPIFSVYIEENFYNLKEILFKSYFQKGKRYFFKVYSFNEKEKKIGESQIKEVYFK